MTSTASILDIFNPFSWSGSNKRRHPGPDDAFADILKSYSDLWREAFTEPNVLCCPVSGSLGDEITKDQLASHILIPHQRNVGEFRTLKGEHVYLSGNDLVCGAGFPEPRRVKVLHVGQLTDSYGKSTTIYRLSRPLVGGIAAPEEVDEVTLQVMFKYVAALRSFPQAEAIFVSLDDFIKEINFVGAKSPESFARIKPSLAASLQNQWLRTTDRLVRSGAMSATLGGGPESAKLQIGQILECYMMHAVAKVVYPWVTKFYAKSDELIISVVRSLQGHTQSDLGIPAQLQCFQGEAIKEISNLADAETPVDKLLVLKRTVGRIRERIDINARRKFPGEELELSTDDLVLIVIWVLIQAYRSYRTFPADLRYASHFHFNSSSKSELGFNLCHFQVALAWFADRSWSTRTNSNSNIEGEECSSGPKQNDDNNSASQTLDTCEEASSSTMTNNTGGGSDSPLSCSSANLTETIVEEFSRDAVSDDPISSESDKGSNGGGVVTNSIKSASPSTTIEENGQFPTQFGGVNADTTQLVVPFSATENASKSALSDATSLTSDDAELSGFMRSSSDVRVHRDLPQSICECTVIANSKWICDVRGTLVTKKTAASTVSDVISAGSSSRIPSVGVSNSSTSKAPSERSPTLPDAGKTTVLLGKEDHGLPKRATIISEATNKAGAVLSVTGAGGAFAAINIDGDVYTWGFPDCGRLGRGPAAELDAFAPTVHPTRVDGLEEASRVRQVSCGRAHMLAVTYSGQLYAWGDNRCAQLGLVPQSPSSSNSIVSSGGGGKVSGTPANSPPSTPNSPPGNFYSGGSTTAAATAAVVMAAASPVGIAQVPGGELSCVMACGPVSLDHLRPLNPQAVACGAYHSLCLAADGNVYSWGRGANGRLGQFTDKITIPEHAVGKPGIVRCNWQARQYVSLTPANAEKPLNEAAIRGHLSSTEEPSDEGILPTLSPVSSTRLGASFGKVVCIAAGFSHSIAVTASGTVFTWGCGTYGRLGHGSHCDEYIPQQVMALTGCGVVIVSASAGFAHSLFLSDEGLLFGCGLDSKGQVGALPAAIGKRGEEQDKFDRHSVLCPRPVVIRSLEPRGVLGNSVPARPADDVLDPPPVVAVVAIACGDYHSAAITAQDRLVLWGDCGMDGGSVRSGSNGMRGAGASGSITSGSNNNTSSSAGSAKSDDCNDCSLEPLKSDITPFLGGVPKSVGCSGTYTLVTVS